MAKTKHSLENSRDLLCVILPRTYQPVARRSGCGRKFKRLVDRQCREVDIVFWAVLDVSSEMFLQIFGGKRVVVDGSLNRVVLLPLVGESFQESTAP